MAYNCYIACDHCGIEGGSWVNHTVSLSIAEMLARRAGWQVGKKGWFCPACKERMKSERAIKAARKRGKNA